MSVFDSIRFDGADIPLVKPRRVKGGRFSACDGAVVQNCPFCGSQHRHGWGDGPRVSHCVSGGGTYYLHCEEP